MSDALVLRVGAPVTEATRTAGDGTFRYYTPPLPQGENVVTVTAQNTKGGVSTQTKNIVVQ